MLLLKPAIKRSVCLLLFLSLIAPAYAVKTGPFLSGKKGFTPAGNQPGGILTTNGTQPAGTLPATDTLLLRKIMEAYPQYFAAILADPSKKEVQILYTQINRDKHNKPTFVSYSFHLNPHRYFYPASTVKLPVVIFALEKLHELNKRGLTRETTMKTDSDFTGQTKVETDTSSSSGYASLGQYIRRVLLVSDNLAYNRLYEFTGRREINQKLKKYNLNGTRIMSRLTIGDGGDSARHTNPISFYGSHGLIYHQPGAYDDQDYPANLDNMYQGTGYLDRKGNMISKPYDFSRKNIYPLTDQQQLLTRLIFPEAFTRDERFNLTSADYRFIYDYMSRYPGESDKPAYSGLKKFPQFCKYLYYGGDSSVHLNPSLRIFNKVGDAYGYTIDNAYFADSKNKVEFLLSAVIQSNEDGIFNDDKYEYTTICLPFLRNLGQVIYNYELKRPKENMPDLSRFEFDYSKKVK